jgi:hypothetical protein
VVGGIAWWLVRRARSKRRGEAAAETVGQGSSKA